MVKKSLMRKEFAVGIILLFVGTTILQTTAQNTEKIVYAPRGDWLFVSKLRQGIYSKIQQAPRDASCYGFLINVTENQSYGTQFNITRLLNALLNQNISIYWITCEITLSVQGLEKGSRSENRTFQKGCFIIAFSHDGLMNTKSIALVYQKWLTSQLSIYKIMQPSETFTAYRLREPRIAYYNCTSIDTIYYPERLRQAGFTTIDLLTAQQTIRNLTVDNYDIFIWGGQFGTYAEAMNDTLSPTGLHVTQQIREFVEAGGNYIGSCYGGWRAASGYQRPWGYPLDLSYSNLLNLVPIQLELVKYNVYRALPGAGTVSLTIQNQTHPLAFGLPNTLSHLFYCAGPLFISRRMMPQSEKEIIGILSDVNRDHWSYNKMMDIVPFWNSRIISTTTKNRIAHHWMNDSIGAPMWIDSTFGDGKVIIFGVHPEYTFAWDGFEYCSPPRIMYNTIWYTIGQGPFTYEVELPVTFSTITVDAGGPYIAEINQVIQFHGSALNGESPFKWYWEYGLTFYEYFYVDPYNNTREGQDPWFSFSNSGTYRIALVVTDALGDIGYDMTTVTVYKK